jgi:hypothetical protein
MELVGDEKRIPALFSDLKVQDQSIAPSFDRLWKSAQTTKPERLLFVEPLVVLGSVAIIAALAMWSAMWSNDTSTQPAFQLSVAIVSSAESRAEAPKKLVVKDRRVVQRRKVRPKEPEHVVVEQAAVLSSWQSPTGSLMEFTAATVFKSLPDLTESVTDLESYLSNNGVKEFKK